MKKVIVSYFVFLSVLVSCKKEKEKEVEIRPDESKNIVIEEPVSGECYSGSIKKDTILINLTIKGNQVTKGKLSYKFYEKDTNEGTMVGELRGDTLIADYTFMSEGVSSIRQVAFLKMGNTYVEGYGDVVDDNKGKVTFKDTKQLKFDGKTVLSKVDCRL
ncbi:hypothetical protein ACFX5E_01370 [Flavobacterium sp. LS2P90]|uniref:Lipoprotein n=1 Tax=Flavobacterium xylosi TaxID=3230415 RepID=A0ABW6HSY9_9FLAO